MPTFNRLELLRSTVQSVLGQSIRDWELIVADDGSGQEVLDFLDGLAIDERVRVLRLPHSGNPGRARNVAINSARAPYVAFLDSDDLWESPKLELQLALMGAEPECGWSYGAFTIVDAEGTPFPSEHTRTWTAYRGHIFTEVVRAKAAIRTPAVIASTALVRDVGGFDEAIDCSEDYDLWMRLAQRSPACALDESLVRVRRNPRHRTMDVSHPYKARDYSLHKLSRQATGTQRALLEEERSRNAMALSAAIAARGDRWGAVAAIGRSLPFSWKYPHWWYGGARVVARACLGR